MTVPWGTSGDQCTCCMHLLPWATHQRSGPQRLAKQRSCGFVQRWHRICPLPLILWENLRYLPFPMFLGNEKLSFFPRILLEEDTGYALISLSQQSHEFSKKRDRGRNEEDFFFCNKKSIYVILPRRRFRKTVRINYQFQAGSSSFFKWWLLTSLKPTLQGSCWIIWFGLWNNSEWLEKVSLSFWQKESEAQKAMKGFLQGHIAQDFWSAALFTHHVASQFRTHIT